MPDDGFETFLADARSLDPTISADAACRAWTILQGVRTLWQLRRSDMSEDEWRIVLLATRAFFMRVDRRE